MNPLEPIAPHLLSASDKAKRLMAATGRANGKSKLKADRASSKPALPLTEVLYRGIVRRELIRGGNPLMHSARFLAELMEDDKQLAKAVDAWHERMGSFRFYL